MVAQRCIGRNRANLPLSETMFAGKEDIAVLSAPDAVQPELQAVDQLVLPERNGAGKWAEYPSS